MAIRTLNQHIFRLSAGLVLVSTIAILFNVWSSTIEQAKRQLAKNLNVAESVITQVLNDREDQLFNKVQVLTSGFPFKQTVATRDNATIKSALENHGARVSADLMALISLDGIVTSSTLPEFESGLEFNHPELLQETLLNGGATTFLMVGDELYQILLLTVDAPTPIAITLIGFEMNIALLESFKATTLLDITLRLKESDKTLFVKSTDANLEFADFSATNIEQASWLSFFVFSESQYFSRELMLYDIANSKLTLTMSEAADKLFADFYQLQIKITIIAGLCLLLSLMLGALVAKRLSKPLKSLAAITRTIAKGDYDGEINVHSSTREIADLSDAFKTMQSNVKEREQQISYQAKHDLLTRLQNRYQISTILDTLFSEGKDFQVVGANILGFRGINDVFGHPNGDQCLKEIARRLHSLGGECARLNGGEFLWIPAENHSIADLKDVQAKLEMPIVVQDVVMKIRISIGILNCPADCQNTVDVLKRLTIVLDEARKQRNAIAEFIPEFEERYTRRLSIILELKKTLSSQVSELALFYQPKLHLQTSKTTHVEALIRWNSESLGFVPPDEFIGIAEQAGLIAQVTNWVIEQAIKDAKAFEQAGLNFCIAINLSAKDIVNPDLLPNINMLLKQYNVASHWLAFEITESDIVSDPKKAIQELSAFREAGFSLAIDDFGTGYSSLAYLKSLPVTELKIDKSFVLKLAEDNNDQQIVQTIIELAHTFNLGVIAEGVEDLETLSMLHQHGCEYAQGYYICRPTTAEKLVVWLDENKDKNWLKK